MIFEEEERFISLGGCLMSFIFDSHNMLRFRKMVERYHQIPYEEALSSADPRELRRIYRSCHPTQALFNYF